MSCHTLKSGVGKLNMIHRIIRVSLRLILGTDPGDACAKQLNWSLTAFAHVSATTCRKALKVLVIPFVSSSRKKKIRYKKFAFSACSTYTTTNDSKSSKVSGTTASTEGAEDVPVVVDVLRSVKFFGSL